MALAFASSAQALDWRFEPRVGATATYTDNASHSDSDPQDALILSVTPGFSLTSEGSRRVNAAVQYSLRGSTRFGHNEDETLNHNLGASGHAELVEDFVYIDGSAHVSQELISLFGPLVDAESDDSNRATVGTYSISPYIQKRLGTFANMQARYTASGAIFENKSNVPDSGVNAFSAALSSGTRFNDFTWGLNYSIREANNRNDVDTTFERASATAGYALTRKFRLTGTVGKDWNEYLSTSGTDGSSYSVGFGWSPTRRTSIDASVGERYWGRTFGFSGSHRARSSKWNAGYSENVSDITQQLLDQSDDLYFTCLTAPHFRPATDLDEAAPPDCVGPYPANVTAEGLQALFGWTAEELAARGFPTLTLKGIYIIKNFNAGVSWDIGRLGLGLSAQDTRRIYQALDNAEDRVQSLTGTASYRVSAHTTANGSLSLTRHSADGAVLSGTARDDEILGLSLGLSHRFSQDLNGALTFRHTQRDSNETNSDYQENRLTGTVSLRF